MSKILSAFSLLICLPFIGIAQKLNTPVRHVIVVGVDGLSPDGIQNAPTPVLERLMQEGAYTMHARSVTPSSSSPNWASIIMGAGVEQHGIWDNDYERDEFILPPVVQGSDDIFPTIFGEAHQQIVDAEIGAIYHWGGFGRLFEKKAVDYDVAAANEFSATELAASYINNKKPNLCFIHLDHVDHAGHEYGHGTAQYYEAVSIADSLIGRIVAAIENAGIADQTLLMICSDHGGIGKGHGGLSLAEMEVPLLLWGKNIRSGFEIPTPVFQYDHAATMAFALGLEQPYAWIGRPVRCAFNGFTVPKLNYPLLTFLDAPTFNHPGTGVSPAGGLFPKETLVSLTHPHPGQLYYTLDGAIPTLSSKMYKEPFPLKENTQVRAALFQDGKRISEIAEAQYRFLKKNAKPDIIYKYYLLEDAQQLPDFSILQPAGQGNSFEICSEGLQLPRSEQIAVVFEKDIEILANATYFFYIRSDDGSKLYVDDVLCANNDGNHGVKSVKGKRTLSPGKHRVRVEWYNGGGGAWLDVYLQKQGEAKKIL